MRAVPVRVALLLAAIALAGFGLIRLSDHRACERAGVDAYAFGLRQAGGLDADNVLDALLDRCRGALKLSQSSEAFGRGGRIDASERLAREAVRREPERWLSWLALSRAQERRGELVDAQRSATRVRALNPRYGGQAPGVLPAGAAIAP